MSHRTVPAFSHPFLQQLFQQAADPEIPHVGRVLADEHSNTPTADYLMLDLFGTVLEVRRMSHTEARDTNLELEAQDVPYHWAPLSVMVVPHEDALRES